MFDIFRRLNPGLDITYAGLDRDMWDVTVTIDRTRQVPLRLLSQGSLATLSWVGLLVKRLADVYGDRVVSDKSSATGLVLIDEVDAHLHPEWQRNLIPALAEHFPAIQFIASTHSPLIVGALAAGTVATVKRLEDDQTEVTYSSEFTGWRADQILTSQAFGLESSRDVTTSNRLSEYGKALSKKSAGEAPDVAESRRRMERELRAELPGPGETAAQRSAASIIDEVLDSHLNSVTPEQASEMSEQLTLYLRRVRGEDIA
jgi:predicted ATP-binding protein involved in virulence